MIDLSIIEKRISEYGKSLESVGIEWVIQDSLSSIDDLTKVALPAYASLYKSADTGIYSALNIAINSAKGRWILILGSDDLINVSQVNLLLQALNDTSDDTIVLLTYCLVDSNSQLLVQPKSPKRYHFYKGMPVSHQCILAPKKLFEFKSFDLDFKFAADMDWLLYFYLKGVKFRILQSSIPFVSMSLHGISSQLSYRPHICREFILILRKYQFSPFELLYLRLSYLKSAIKSIP